MESSFVVENFQEYQHKHSMNGKVVMPIANIAQMIVEDHQPFLVFTMINLVGDQAWTSRVPAIRF